MKFFETRIEKTEDAATIIDRLFNEFGTLPPREPSKYISPSGLSCPVSCALKLQGMLTDPVKESFRSRAYAENGEDRHTRIQDFLSKTEYWVDVAKYIKEKNIPLEVVAKDGHEVLLVSEKYKARFKCDGMLLINGEYHVLEIKTEKGSITSKRDKPDEKHYLQGVTYTLLLDVNNILWIYEGREYLNQKIFLQNVSAKEKEDVGQYILNIIENTWTPENLVQNKKACTYCAYKNYCTMIFNEKKRKEMEAKWFQDTPK